MPYAVRQAGEKWETYNPESGKVYGTHDSKAGADAQRRALYANAPPSEEEAQAEDKAAASAPPWGQKKKRPEDQQQQEDNQQPAGDREGSLSDGERGTEPGADEAAGRKPGVGVDAGAGSAGADEDTPTPGDGQPPSKFGKPAPGQPAPGQPGQPGQPGMPGQPPQPEPWKPVTAADLGCIMEPMDAALLKRLINTDGRTPVAPEPAFVQLIKGMPATTYTTDELVYSVRNPRTNRIYGYSPVEQVLTTINIALRRQLSQLEYYTAGNIPDLILGVPETWNPDQIAQFQAWWDALLSGDTAERRKARFVPGGTTPFPLKDPKVKDEWDDWLARIICFAFSLPYQALVKEVNRATAESSSEQSAQEGLEPLKLWFKDTMDEVLEKAFDASDMEFVWADEEITDPKTKAEVWSIAVGKPWAKPSEARAAYGLPADPEMDAQPAPMDPMAALGMMPPGAEGEPGAEDQQKPGEKPPPFGGKPNPFAKKPGGALPFQKKPGAAAAAPPAKKLPPWMAEKAALASLVKEAVAEALTKSQPSPSASQIRFVRDEEGRIVGAKMDG